MKRLALLVSLCALSCGYRPLRSGLAGTPRIAVVSAHASMPGGAQAALEGEAASGARAELAKYGALANDAKDRLRIDLVRLDERSEGERVVDGKARARGVRVRIIARGTIVAESGSWETADVESTELVAVPDSVLAWEGVRSSAVRRVARDAGARVAHEVLGLP